MAKRLHVGVRLVEVDSDELNFAATNRNETLRLHPAIPSGSQWTVGKGKGAKVFGNL
jgi:hypothetical protein